MCGPLLAIAGTGMSIMGTLAEGQSQSASLKAQAAFNRRQASMEYVKGSYDVAIQKRQEKRILATQQTGYASGGIATDTGSPIDAYTATDKEAEMDRQAIRYGRDVTVSNYNYKAQIDTMNAKAAKTASYFKAAAEGISGLTKLSDQASSMFSMA